MNERKPWTREELILAINLYCRTPFGKIHFRNPEIIDLAERLGRTPGSVSYKLANFASLDPSLDRKGASNVSKLDREVWQEFYNNWEEMAFQSETLVAQKTGSVVSKSVFSEDEDEFLEGKTKDVLVKTRVNQNFFRKMVLSAYNNTCCITGISISELLIASHIIPWSVDSKNRLNPRNGLCLNALHDRAFDKGLIAISDDFRILLSPRLHKMSTSGQSLDFLLRYENKKITLPNRFVPDKSFLARHKDTVFQS
jgi:putative restriction endonuclease